jgi:MraZ protein
MRPMFLGDHQHTLDAKGRVSLPAKFRAEMPGKLVVAKGLDSCLYVYPAEEYTRFVTELVAREDFDPRVRQVRRFFTTGAVEIELDSAGRVSLPANLRAFANLTKDVAVTGNGNRIEIWDAAAWSLYNGETAGSIEDLAQELADAGLL